VPIRQDWPWSGNRGGAKLGGHRHSIQGRSTLDQCTISAVGGHHRLVLFWECSAVKRTCRSTVRACPRNVPEEGQTPTLFGRAFSRQQPGLQNVGLWAISWVVVFAGSPSWVAAQQTAPPTQRPAASRLGSEPDLRNEAARPENETRLREIVDEIARLRNRTGSAVSGVLESMFAGENHQQQFRRELTELARASQLHEAQQWESRNPLELGPEPRPVETVGWNTLLQPQLQPQGEPRLAGTTMTPAPLQPQPLPLPMARSSLPARSPLVGLTPVHPAAVQLRQIARQLESAAADLEDLGLFDEADRLRNQCRDLRQLGRQSN
jgi:hypothetical protein